LVTELNGFDKRKSVHRQVHQQHQLFGFPWKEILRRPASTVLTKS
jgi:hypothetical protein